MFVHSFAFENDALWTHGSVRDRSYESDIRINNPSRVKGRKNETLRNPIVDARIAPPSKTEFGISNNEWQ